MSPIVEALKVAKDDHDPDFWLEQLARNVVSSWMGRRQLSRDLQSDSGCSHSVKVF